jgi:Arb2-like domain
LTDAANVILIGAGEGCYGVEHLVRNRDVEGTVKGIVNVFGDFEPKSIGDTDEDKIYWYMKVFPISITILIEQSSRVYIGPRNPILRRKKIPKRFGQCLQTRISLFHRLLTTEFGEMNKLLNIHFEEVTTWLTSRIPVDEDRMDTS